MDEKRAGVMLWAACAALVVCGCVADASAQLRDRGGGRRCGPDGCYPLQVQVYKSWTLDAPDSPFKSVLQSAPAPIAAASTQDEPICLVSLDASDPLDLRHVEVSEAVATDEDRLDRVIRATCRVTVRNVCGSGTIVGRDQNGRCIVLTNAHVAGTTKGVKVKVQRWNQDGSDENGVGEIIAAGYSSGKSIDFALLRMQDGFGGDVVPIPLADRYPAGMTTTNGCPRCEWPSLQVLKMQNGESQVLTWKPEAIGGRSGSSLIDYNPDPKVVGLLTWGGNGDGLGQSTPFLLAAIRGKLPTSFEPLPAGVHEVPFFTAQDGQSIVDQITEDQAGLRRRPPADPDDGGTIDDSEPRRRFRPLARLFDGLLENLRSLVVGALALVGFVTILLRVVAPSWLRKLFGLV